MRRSQPPRKDSYTRDSGRAWVVSASLAVATVLATMAAILWRPILSYRLINEDFSLALNSSRPYFNIGQWATWFTEGYTTYFVNFPDWPIGGYAFSRPLMNLSFYLQSLLVPVLGDPAYLVIVYLSLAVTVGLVVVALKRYTDVSPWLAAVLAISVGLSPAWHEALLWPAITTNALALAFSVGSLVVLDPARGVPGPQRMSAVVLLQLMAVASHEVAIVLPFITIALLYGMSPIMPRPKELWPFAVPLAYLLIGRALVESEGVYALDFGMSGLAARVVRFAASPLVPYDANRMLFWHPPTTLSAAVPVVFALLANAILLALLARGLFADRSRHTVGMAAATAIAAAPGLLMLGDPRFMGITLVVALLAVFRLTDQRALVLGAAAVVLLAQIGLYGWGVVSTANERRAELELAGAFFDYIQTEIEEQAPTTLVLVNDRVGYWSARAMLETAVWPRGDIEVVVLNNYQGPPSDEADLQIGVDGKALAIVNRLAPEQILRLDGADVDLAVRNKGFEYTPSPHGLEGRGGGFRATRQLSEDDRILVVGIDAKDQSLLQPVLVGQ